MTDDCYIVHAQLFSGGVPSGLPHVHHRPPSMTE